MGNFLVVLIFGGSVFCFAKPPLKNHQRAIDDNLTREFARHRKDRIEKVEYNNTFVFSEKGLEFQGETQIDFKLKNWNQSLSVDFVGQIESLTVNDKKLKNYKKRVGSFDIPSSALKEQNRIKVSYTGRFSENGHGFQRVVDPLDQGVYIYSDSEPYYAHTLFPCFDQPDLKARFQTKVTAPTTWKVISNELVSDSKQEENPELTTITFRETVPLSTYLYFVGAGPFVEWKDLSGSVPLYLYARKSLASSVDYLKIFETTQKGLKFYGDYFETPYPFSKYGQIFIPEFAWGGMENPGAVTLNEMNIFRGPVSTSRYEGRDDLILHEMAHMWFGDLVTMNWWDDLWLNESFASYLADLANQRAMKAQGAFLNSIGSKGWGYWQDQLVTTHPIESDVPDTRSSKSNFDGITYAKGGATLKQLHFFVGEEGFRIGLRNYFKKFAFQNTSRADFIQEIASASGQDLNKWTQAWLQSAGPHRVQTKWTCNEGKIKTFLVLQSPNTSKIYSPHKTRMALYSKKGDRLKIQKTQDVNFFKEKTEVSQLIGENCPDFVFPNLEDYDYALYSLDEKSLPLAKAALAGGVEQNTVRFMTWNILAQMVRDLKLSTTDYFEMALEGLEKEKDPALLAMLLGRHGTIKNYFYSYLSNNDRDKWAPKIETIAFNRLSAEKPGSDLQITFFDFYISMAHTSKALNQLANYLTNQELPEKFILDQDRRWKIIKKLAYYGFPEVQKLIATEEKTDNSTSGKRNSFVAQNSIPDKKIKAEFWKSLKKAEKIPFSSLREASGSFHSEINQELSKPYVDPFFKKVSAIDWKKNDDLAEIYFENLFPQNLCSQDLLKKSERELKRAQNLTAMTRRYWLEANDELGRCVAIRN
jgi:aminopeptidase N